MLIPLQDVIDRYGLAISGVIHAGAHLGQEAEIYRSIYSEVNLDELYAGGALLPGLDAFLEEGVHAQGDTAIRIPVPGRA